MNKNDYIKSLSGLEVAVIGMAGRFPQANNIDEFWDNLKNGRECISFFTEEELILSGCDESLVRMPNYIKAKGVVEDIEYFDSSFFGYTPKEANVMDPQLRLLHECAWHALEDAGYNPLEYSGNIGIILGASPNFAWEANANASYDMDFSLYPLVNGNFASTLIAYKLNLKGPSMVINTACSTSLVSIHQACRSLLTGECSMMIAGGTSITAPYKQGYLYEENMIMSPDGHCRPFDNDARGTIGGSGVGLVVLKRLKDAIKDNDRIYAVIKGSSVNNDGNKKVGYSAPSVEGQALLIKKALGVSKVQPEDISYIEAHGTGTSLGDPTEIQALIKAFNTEERQYCGIGSVKSNIGHLDVAAGIASFIKTVMIVGKKFIPPTINFECPNLKIDFINSPFYVSSEGTEIVSHDKLVKAGVNSLGIGGTNAHIILEEYPDFKEDIENVKNFLPKHSFEKREYNTKILPFKKLIDGGIHSEQVLNNIDKAIEPDNYDRDGISGEYVKPQTELELLIADALKGITGISMIGVEDNFFEIGIDSIKAIRLASILLKSGYRVGMKEIMANPTISLLNSFILNIGAKSKADFDKSDEKDYCFPEGDIETIQDFINKDSNIEEIFPLSPMQKQILAQNIAAYKKGDDVFTLTFKIEGNINSHIFIEAWKKIIEIHPILRTAFYWRRLEEPVQMVSKKVEPEFLQFDWTSLSKIEQEKQKALYIDGERARGFKVTEAPLMRWMIAKTGSISHMFVWTFQHSLIDGWSMHLIINQVLDIYKALTNNEPLPQDFNVYKFSHYIRWLQHQREEAAQAFWARELEGFIAKKDDSKEGKKRTSEFHMATYETQYDEEFTGKLDVFSKKHGLTLNTLIQTAWGLTLCSKNDTDDIILGIESSGRSQDLNEIEKIAGILITVMPVRFKLNSRSSVEFMRSFQNNQLEMRSFEYVTLSQISKWSKTPFDALQTAVYERTLVFQNIPMELEQKDFGGIKVNIEGRVSQLNIPLRLYVTPGKSLKIFFCYNEHQYSIDAIEDLFKKFSSMLCRLMENHQLDISKLLKYEDEFKA